MTKTWSKDWEVNQSQNPSVSAKANLQTFNLYQYPIYKYSLIDLQAQLVNAINGIANATLITFISAIGYTYLSALKRLIINVNAYLKEHLPAAKSKQFILCDYQIVVDQTNDQPKQPSNRYFLSAHLVQVN